LSKNIINDSDFENIKMIRRKNFEYLLTRFIKNERGILPFRELTSGVCPLFFPIILESAEKRNMLYKTLKDKGITTHPWWERFHQEVPWKDFPDAVYLKQRLFGLPIHQDLTYEHLDRVIEEFEKAYKSM
jgi:dTDP-4-amino-4,6-dideoxygalactose transaminase